MSTTEQLLVDDGTVASSINASGFQGVDPRRRRYGYNPGIYRMEMEPRESGRQQRIIPAGILLQFRTAELVAENFDINVPMDEYQKEVKRDFTAEWFIRNVSIRYEEQGFRELSPLTILEDDEAQKYFNALHPAFEELKHECPFELQNCVSCRLEFLGEDDRSLSDAMRARMKRLKDPDVADDLLTVLRVSLIAYRDYCTTKWASLLGELSKRKSGEPGIAKLDAAEHHVRRHLHEHPPEAQGAIEAANFGEAASQAQVEGFKELAQAMRESKPDSNSELLKALIENQRIAAERQAQTDKLLAALLEQKQTVPAPAPTETPAPKTKRN